MKKKHILILILYFRLEVLVLSKEGKRKGDACCIYKSMLILVYFICFHHSIFFLPENNLLLLYISLQNVYLSVCHFLEKRVAV